MSEFTPINTQEEFDQAIKSRLAREKDTLSKQFAADQSELRDNIKTLTDQNNALTQAANDNAEKMETLQKQLEEANGKISGYQMDIMKTNIAVAKGLPLELRDRLSGTTEEELSADADKLAKLFTAQNNNGIPQAHLNDDVASTNAKDEALKKVLRDLDRKGE